MAKELNKRHAGMKFKYSKSHRGTRPCQIDGRRCSKLKCRKVAKDLIDNNYLCRIHSPMREGFEG